MNERKENNEKLLIDFILGRLEAPDVEAVRRRLQDDEDLKKLHSDLANTFAAMKLLPEGEPPEDLVDKTLQRLRRQRATEALLAREKPGGRVLAPTFSLRELGALAAAAALLVAIFVPSIYKARQRAHVSNCAANVGQIGAAVQAHANAKKGYLPSVASKIKRWLPGGNQPAVSNSAALFKLVVGKYASPTVFQCPAIGGSSFVVQAGMSDFPDSQFISYSYHHAIGPKRVRIDDPALQAENRKEMSILADSTPLFVDGHFRRDRVNASASDNHDGAGQNVLYLDMHVEWKNQPHVGVNGDNIFLAGNIREYQGVETPLREDDTFLLPAFSPQDLEH